MKKIGGSSAQIHSMKHHIISIKLGTLVSLLARQIRGSQRNHLTLLQQSTKKAQKHTVQTLNSRPHQKIKKILKKIKICPLTEAKEWPGRIPSISAKTRPKVLPGLCLRARQASAALASAVG